MKMNEHPLQQTQQAFCAWIRDPRSDLPAEFVTERMQVYRTLLFNNVSSFINLVYPIARTLLSETKWQSLLQDFFQNAQNQSPFYNDISLQFREYLDEQQHPVLQEYPWLAELLQFEWLELYLDTVEIEENFLTSVSLAIEYTHLDFGLSISSLSLDNGTTVL